MATAGAPAEHIARHATARTGPSGNAAITTTTTTDKGLGVMNKRNK